jgi:pantetheine-phosphate adenylyltransferase
MNSMKIAVFPGSFDPITSGHESIIRRAIPLFDQIIVAIGINIDKSSYFSLQDRLNWIRYVIKDCPTVSVESYNRLTVDFCLEKNALYLIRGLRTSADFEFERSVAQVNNKLVPEIETVFLLTKPEHVMVTSSIVREVHRNGGDVSQFVPAGIIIPLQQAVSGRS